MLHYSVRISFSSALAVMLLPMLAVAQTPISKRLSAVGENIAPLVRSANDYDDEAYSELLDNGSIFERTRSEYDPVTIRQGSYIFAPAIDFSTEYNDNIFYSDADEESDLLFSMEPGIVITSDFERHALNFQAAGDFGVYADNTEQNFSDYVIGVDGQYDFNEEFYFTSQAGHQHLHEDRSAPNSQTGSNDTQTEFDLSNVGVALVKNDGLINVRFGLDYLKWDYDDTRLINNDDRDRDEYIESLRLGYDLTDSSDVYVEGVLNQRDYDNTFDDNNLQRSSDGYVISVGANYAVPSVLQTGAYVGFASQDYDDPSFDTVNDVVYGATALWNMTSITSLLGDFTRTLRDSVNPGTSAYVESRYLLRLEHELLRNLLLNVEGEYRDNRFEGSNNDREDDLYAAGFGAEYFVSRDAKLALDYTFRARDSNAAGVDFSQNSLLATVGLRF